MRNAAKKTGKKSFTPSATGKKVPLWTRLNVRLSETDKMLFARHLATLLNSGLAIDEVLDTLLQQAKGANKKVLETLYKAVREGRTLADGMEEFPHIFSSVFVNLVRAGEASGTLQKNLQYIAEHLHKKQELRKKMTGVMVYPVLVMVGAIGVGTGIVLFVLPNLTALFRNLKVELPFTTRFLLWTADFFQAYGVSVGIGLVALVVTWLLTRRLAFVMPVTHRLWLSLPLIGRIAKHANIARMMRLIGTLLKSGVSMQDVLLVTLPTIHNVRYVAALGHAQEEVASGNSLTHALGDYPRLFPPIALRLINVGEASGTLDEMCLYLAEFYEEEIDNSTRYLSILLEPLLIIAIGLMVLVLALGVITPMYKIIGNV